MTKDNNEVKIMQSIQAELKAPKGQTNKFGGYSYRSAEDILEAVKPLLNKYDCYLTISDEIVEVGGRVYVKATASLHESHRHLVADVTAYAREAEVKKGMDDAQLVSTLSMDSLLSMILKIPMLPTSTVEKTPKLILLKQNFNQVIIIWLNTITQTAEHSS